MRRGKVKPYTLHRNRRTYEQHRQKPFRAETFAEVETEAITDWVDGPIL